MPLLHTDDGPRRLRAVWLGPTGATLPFEWTYVQWVATLAAIPVTVGLLWGLGTARSPIRPRVVDDVPGRAVALIWGPALGVYATVRVMRHVSFDQPLAARARLVRAELRPRPAPRPPTWWRARPRSPSWRPVGHAAWAGSAPHSRCPLPLPDPRTLVPTTCRASDDHPGHDAPHRLRRAVRPRLAVPHQPVRRLARPPARCPSTWPRPRSRARCSSPRRGCSAGSSSGPQNWDFKTHTERVHLWDQVTYRLGALTSSLGVEVEGRPLRLRVTTRPYPAFEFARALDEASPHRLPDVADETWDRYLQHAQHRLQSTGLDQKLVAVGVWVCPPVSKQVMVELVGGTEHPDLATVKVLNEVAAVERIMAGPGFDGRPLSARDMAFLFHRSLSMGTPVPAAAGVGASRWEPDELAAATQRCAWTAEPFGTTVTVHTERHGQALDRHVAVVSLGSMPDQTWPENGREPWMLALDTLPFGVEWSLNGTLLRPSVLEGTLAREQLRAEAIRRHYHEHRLTPPPAVDRAIHAATGNLDQVTDGDLRTAARFLGTIRVATFADTKDQAVEQAARIVARFGERFHIEAAHVLGQPAQLREFIPGEPRVKEGFQRRLPIKYLAAGLPNVGADLGTPAGPYLGYGSGTARRAVCFDMHYGPEVLNTPGLFTISAEPGAGKSVLIGALAYNAARAGEPTIILDPSGPLAALCDLPELAPFARKLDLTAAEPGTLSPYQLIPEPQPDSFRRPDGTVDVPELGRAFAAPQPNASS